MTTCQHIIGCLQCFSCCFVEVTAFMYNPNLGVASFQLVKPFIRKLASDNLVSPIPPPPSLQLCNKESGKQHHQLHHNKSMRNDESKMLEKTTTVFRLNLAKGTRRKGITLWLERLSGKSLISLWLKDILQSSIFRTMCSWIT